MKKFQFRSYVEKGQVENVLEQAKFRSAGISSLFAVNSLLFSFYYVLAKDTAEIIPTATANNFALITLVAAVSSAFIAITAFIIGMVILKPNQEEIEGLKKQVKTVEVIEVAQIAKQSKYYRAQTMLFSISILLLMLLFIALRAA